MTLFKSRTKRALERENEYLTKELTRLAEENSELRTRNYRLFMYEGEFEKTITEKLELTPLQVSRLRMLFSIEHCRAVGVDEDRIIKYEAVEKYLNKTDTAEES